MVKPVTLLFILFSYLFAFTQVNTNFDDIAKKYASTITAEELREIVYFLAGDSCAGRETGQIGQKIAANYIARFFKQLNLPPVVDNSYFQSFPIETKVKTQINILNQMKKEDIEGIFFLNGFKSCLIHIKHAVFDRFGDDLPTLNSYENIQENNEAVFLMITDSLVVDESIHLSDKKRSIWLENIHKKITYAENKGASIIFFIIPDHLFVPYISDIVDIAFEFELDQYYNPNHIPYLFISEFVVKKWLNITGVLDSIKTETFSNLDIVFDIKTTYDTLYGENVLGFIEGTDLKHEIVVITAHYDHLGNNQGRVYYGADDDGSGTAAALEIAEAFCEARNHGFFPRRSILIMPVSGEEKGLLGSEYYVNNPIFPLNNTVANLNIDMIGRIDENHRGNLNYVYIIGSDRLSTELHLINENANSNFTKLDLDYTYNDPKDPNRFYYRSDHYNFAKNGIPVIFYFTGVHEDYHKPSDTPDKLDYNKIEKISQLVFYTAWSLANRESRPIINKKEDY